MDQRQSDAEQNRLDERAFEAIGEGEEDYDLVFDPATGELHGATDADDEDRVPATQMAREGFFCAAAVQTTRLWSPHTQEGRGGGAMNARKRARLAKEQELLTQHFPGANIQFPEDPARAGVVAPLSTNRKRRYVLWIPLGGFPNERPDMYIVEPSPLRDRRGKKLKKIGVSFSMHLLSPDAHGYPQICHHSDAAWTPNLTLYKVVMKGRIWLEAYEQHLAKGEDIDRYLPHMA